LRPVSFRRVETDKSKRFPRSANRIAIHYLNLAWIERGSIRNRGDEGENEREMANRARIRAERHRGRAAPVAKSSAATPDKNSFFTSILMLWLVVFLSY
jgi:hypothetical protein